MSTPSSICYFTIIYYFVFESSKKCLLIYWPVSHFPCTSHKKWLGYVEVQRMQNEITSCPKSPSKAPCVASDFVYHSAGPALFYPWRSGSSCRLLRVPFHSHVAALPFRSDGSPTPVPLGFQECCSKRNAK